MPSIYEDRPLTRGCIVAMQPEGETDGLLDIPAFYMKKLACPLAEWKASKRSGSGRNHRHHSFRFDAGPQRHRAFRDNPPQSGKKDSPTTLNRPREESLNTKEIMHMCPLSGFDRVA